MPQHTLFDVRDEGRSTGDQVPGVEGPIFAHSQS